MDLCVDFHHGLLYVTPSVDEDEACCIGWAPEHARQTRRCAGLGSMFRVEVFARPC